MQDLVMERTREAFEAEAKAAICGKRWESSGKDHCCEWPTGHSGRCACDCGEKQPKLGLKKWQFSPKKSNTQIKRERRESRAAGANAQ